MKTRGRSWGNNWEICEEDVLTGIIWKKAKTMGPFDKKMEICVKYW